ncbi:putative cytochrome P450 [Medicago truncatula]|uniref:Cytochrome P450 family 71 protein n=1 Tax=Medicago truncatula TaxID=3880 RepID=Q2MJ14_MEDTR|nr:cytochrome P450 83B1 [Medicago truncatula]ABC59082.1 cytochrome P450 monooxygenase CYP83E8 [Medicago truncatula]KEH29138.1 cytochrome P450 family 71 protein [Medicago truncatula]RHN59313.1 putative cytochrome P450 [Medicago truncatula]
MLSLLLLVLCLTFPLLLFFQKRRRSLNEPHPPGPRGLPIIGNLHQLDNSILYLQFSKLSKIYGPIFSLQLGLRSAIVVSSAEIAKEIFKNNDQVFSNRPVLYGQQKLSYNGSDIAFSQYSDFWREIRKLCVIHIFSAKRVSYYSSIRKFEVKQMIKNISNHAASSNVTNLSEILTSLYSTMICRIAFGKRYEEQGIERSKFHGMLHEFEALMTAFFVSDYITFMSWIDKLRGLHGRLDRNFKEMDAFYQEVIDEHLDPNRQNTDGEFIVDVLLELMKQRLFSTDLTFDHIKGVLVDMLVAATDTTSATIVWAMTALIKNPRVMKKVQEEIRGSRVKKDFLDGDDLQNFVYLKAVIKETLRLYLPAPLLLPRETREKCIVGGYHIPAKTIVYVNAWSIHRDSEIWKDPEEFYPERFLESSINFLGHDFELIPFGAGRRICPGISVAVASLELTLANLLYSFDWELPHGLVKEDIDTEMLPGITQHKKNHLCLVAKVPM